MIPLTSMNVWQLIGLRLVLASVMATLGAWVAVSFKKISHQGLCLLISFAAGALLAVALLDIWPETVVLVGAVPAAISFLTGYALFWGITKYVFHVCPACSATHTEINFKAITISMVVALSIHSFMDGLAIYSGYVSGSKVGIAILLAVVFHKFPEGMALTLVGLGSGLSRLRAFLLSFLLESLTTLAGGVAGILFLVPSASPWVGYILGHVGGGFIFLVSHALLSEVIKHHPRNTILAALAGAFSIGAVGMLIGAF